MRFTLLAVPALVLLLAACGGGSSTTTSNTPAVATTAPASTATAGATATGAATETAAATSATPVTSGGGPPATQPDLPPGTTAITDYYLVPADTLSQASALFKLDITQTAPSGATTTWYTYDGGQWTALGVATVFGGRPPIAEGSFSPVPTNLIVLATTQ